MQGDSWSAKFILRPSWSAKFILQYQCFYEKNDFLTGRLPIRLKIDQCKINFALQKNRKINFALQKNRKINLNEKRATPAPFLTLSINLQTIRRLYKMATYDYRCMENGRVVEVKHGMTEKLNTWGDVCATAGIDVGTTSANSPVQRLISGGQFVNSNALKNPEPSCASGGCGGGMCGF